MSAPCLSVILPVYREQGYLADCVPSVLGQGFRDVELVAVDNASPDHAATILDRVAGEDDRLVVNHLSHVVSLGKARNAGLKDARGRFVWFMRTTDVLPDGVLDQVVACLEEHEPDVLLVGHEVSDVLENVRAPASRNALLSLARTPVFTLAERPRALELATDLPALLLRREFLAKLGASFLPGAFGELAVTYPAILGARRIAALDRVAYRRRDLPNAAYDAHVHGTEFDVFHQYDAVFRLAGPDLARGLLPTRMLRHYLQLLERLPQEDQQEFFERMSASYRHYSQSSDPPPGKRLRLQAELVARGGYRAFRAFKWADRRRRAVQAGAWKAQRRRERFQKGRRRKELEAFYRAQLREPLDPELAVFAAYWYRGYLCNPKAIYEKLRELAPWVRGVWIVDLKHVGSMPNGVDYVLPETREYYRVLARAKYLVNNVNFPNEIFKREGSVHLQTHHGTPVKMMGLDLREAVHAGSRMNFERLLRRCARWDYSISSNELSTLAWERAYPVRYENLEVGYPRNDALANATADDVQRARAKIGVQPDEQVILYAPTHREYERGFVPKLDLERVAEMLGPGYVLLNRVHYFYAADLNLETGFGASRILDVSHYPSVEELCLAADVLMTDYSSIMFDYAVLGRPIVIYAPDWDAFRTLRGTYFDLLAEPPGIVARTEEALAEAFSSGAVWRDGAAALQAAFRARFCPWDDGRASERVVRRVWFGERVDTPRPEPVSDVSGAETLPV